MGSENNATKAEKWLNHRNEEQKRGAKRSDMPEETKKASKQWATAKIVDIGWPTTNAVESQPDRAHVLHMGKHKLKPYVNSRSKAGGRAGGRAGR